jgi:hypothetical protein
MQCATSIYFTDCQAVAVAWLHTGFMINVGSAAFVIASAHLQVFKFCLPQAEY